jgi:hypothetical protein
MTSTPSMRSYPTHWLICAQVSTQDTVMAALHQNQAMGGGGGGGPAQSLEGGPTAYQDKLGGEDFKPSLKPGQMPGQETLKVSAWSVDDVARWLQTLSLGQYREAFVDAAVDGAFLYDLDDDDLRNTLGTELCGIQPAQASCRWRGGRRNAP